MTPQLRIVGIGSMDRGDDAAGRLAVRALGDRLEEGIEISECQGTVIDLVSGWDQESSVLLVDAMVSGAPPGTIRRIDARAQPLPDTGPPTSGHGLGIAEAVALARALGCLPASLVVLAIEGGCFEGGAPLTPAVAAALPTLVERIESEALAIANR